MFTSVGIQMALYCVTSELFHCRAKVLQIGYSSVDVVLYMVYEVLYMKYIYEVLYIKQRLFLDAFC